jgi:beta-lactamase regulating signal transducer with metallopeptidase domain
MQDFIIFQSLPLLLKASWQAAVIVLLVLAAQYTLGRRWNPRWRHTLWWLVLARLALPVTLASPMSLFNFLPASGGAWRVVDAWAAPDPRPSTPPVEDAAAHPAGPPQTGAGVSPWLWLWACGAVFVAVAQGTNHWRIHRRVTRSRPLINEPALNLLEDCKHRMGVRAPVSLVETEAVDGPCLFGALRPRLLLPPGFTRGFSPDELRYVFLHELGHVKRRDISVGWLMAFLQILHWFNPLVWLAFSRMRVDRELACDALALSYAGEQDSKPYGRTIVKLLENFGDSARAPSLAGVVEDKQQMRERIIMIAKFRKSTGGFARAACLLAGLGLVTLTDAKTGGNPSAPASQDAAGPPRIIATAPKIGATDVDPALKEITVTFDRDMGAGMSWTGGGPDYPKSPEGAKAQWRDKRTCVLPVTLQAAHYYRVGINSTSYRNFQSAAGVSAAPSAIYFTTKGAGQELKARVLAPQVVVFNPPNGAQNVSTAVTELRVTFSLPMGGGCSWCTAGDDDHDFPKGPAGKGAYWTADKKTCVLPVDLKPNMTYRVSLNDPDHKNFQSDAGVPLEPAAYTFKTGDKP